MKKFLALLAVAGSSVAVFAEGATEGTITPLDMTAYTTSLKSWVTSFGPVLLGVAGAFAAIWLLRLGIRLIKSVSNSSK